MPDPHPLEFLSNRYQIISKLGEGGMGSVYRAHDPMLDKEVAIKVMSRAMTQTGAIRFQNEARATGALNHANIVQILDFGVTEDLKPYMVMEFLDGCDLGTFIRRERNNISIQELVNIFVGICGGIEHAHQRKILHRDIKPSNIIVRCKGKQHQVSIVDFGIAKMTHESLNLTKSGDLLGSPFYMAPEQAEGRNVDERSDIYSIGCVMYEALAWQPPFKGETVLETLSMHRFEEPRLFEDIAPREIPAWLEDVVFKCLSKSNSDRFQSVVELRRALESGLESSHCGPELLVGASEPEGKRSPLFLGAVSLAVVLGICVVGFVVSGMSSSRLETDVAGNEQRNDEVLKKGFAAMEDGASKPSRMRDSLTLSAPQISFERKADGMKLQAQLTCDEDLKLCNQYPQTEALDLKYSEIDGHGLKYLKLPNVQVVRMGASPLKDEYLHYIKKFRSLKRLELSRIRTLRGDGLKSLNGIQCLEINDSKLSQEFLNNVASVGSLRILTLKRCGFLSPGTLADLLKMRNLEICYIENCNLTDAELTALKRFKVRTLGLRRNHLLTSASIATLRTMPNLRFVHLELCDRIDDAQRIKLAMLLEDVYDPQSSWILPRGSTPDLANELLPKGD